MGYLKPLPARVPRGQRFGENPGLGPNPAGGHNGDDYKSWVGEPIYAAGDGEVIHAGPFDDTYADNFGWNLNFGGNMVVLNLDGDTAPYVEYGHMDKIYVQAGQRVRRGQVIGTTGANDGGTGVISGPHLHVGCLPPNFNVNTPTYGRVNPDLYLTEYPKDAGTISVQSASVTSIEEDFLATLSNEEKDALFGALSRIDNRSANIEGKVGELPTKQYWDDAIHAIARIDQKADVKALAAQIDAAGIADQVRAELDKIKISVTTGGDK